MTDSWEFLTPKPLRRLIFYQRNTQTNQLPRWNPTSYYVLQRVPQLHSLAVRFRGPMSPDGHKRPDSLIDMCDTRPPTLGIGGVHYWQRSWLLKRRRARGKTDKPNLPNRNPGEKTTGAEAGRTKLSRQPAMDKSERQKGFPSNVDSKGTRAIQDVRTTPRAHARGVASGRMWRPTRTHSQHDHVKVR